jgi:hypothetical protein
MELIVVVIRYTCARCQTHRELPFIDGTDGKLQSQGWVVERVHGDGSGEEFVLCEGCVRHIAKGASA